MDVVMILYYLGLITKTLLLPEMVATATLPMLESYIAILVSVLSVVVEFYLVYERISEGK